MEPEPKIEITQEEYEKYFLEKLQNNENIPTEILVKATIGKYFLVLMCPQLPYTVHNDTMPLLQGFAQD